MADDYVDHLLTEDGYLSAVNELRERLRRGGSRDAIQAMRGELACLKEFAEVRKARDEDDREYLRRENAELKRLLVDRSSGSTLSFDESTEVQLPRLEDIEH